MLVTKEKVMKEAESRYAALVEQIEHMRGNRTLATEKAELAIAVARADVAKVKVAVNALEKGQKALGPGRKGCCKC